MSVIPLHSQSPQQRLSNLWAPVGVGKLDMVLRALYTYSKKSKKKVSGGGDFDEDCNMHLHKPWVMHQKRILKKPCKNCLYLPWQIQIQNTHA